METERFLRAPTLYLIRFLILSKTYFEGPLSEPFSEISPREAIYIGLRVTRHAKRLEKLTFEHGRNVYFAWVNFTLSIILLMRRSKTTFREEVVNSHSF